MATAMLESAAPARALKPVTMGRLARRNLRRRPMRLLITMLVVVVGTGFLAGALILKESLSVALESNAVTEVRNVDAAVEPRQLDLGGGGRGRRGGGGPPSSQTGIPVDQLAVVQKAPGVAGAAGIASGSIDILKAGGGSATSGAGGRLWIPVPQLNPFTVVQGQAPTQAGQIAVDAATAGSLGLSVGSPVDLKTSSGPQKATVVGVTNFGENQAANSDGDIFVSQADAAAYLQGGVASYDAIYVAAQAGQQGSVTASVQKAVGDEYSVVDNAALREEKAGSAGTFAGFIGTGLQIFAYVALFVCLFVVYNTFSIVVAQSVREFALLRAIGADTRQIRKSVRREALISGTLGSAAGLVLGAVLIALLLELLPSLKSLAGGAVSLRVGLGTVVQVMIVGVVITVVSAIIPSFRAGRTPPMAALQEVAVDRSATNRFRAVVGPVLIVLGALLMVVGVSTGQAWFSLPGPVFMFVGVLVGGPRIAAWFGAAAGFVVRPVARRVGRLAIENVRRNPTRTATTANALVIGIFLVVFVTAAGGAIRDYAANAVSQFAGPDLTVVAEKGSLPVGLDAKIRTVPGVVATAPVYSSVGLVQTAQGQQLAASVNFSDLGVLGYKLASGARSGSITNLRDDQFVVWSFGGASAGGATVGSPMTVTLANGRQVTGTVGALVDPVFTIPGQVLVSSNAVLQGEPTLQPQQLAIQTEAGQQEQVRKSLEDLVSGYTSVQVMPGNIFGAAIKTIFNFLIDAVNKMLYVAVIIAAFGIVSTLILSVTERRREIGLLRAVGMTRGQTASTIVIESVIVALLGTLVGMVFGLFVAFMAVRPIYQDGESSFNWPVQEMAFIVLLGVVLGTLASVIPAVWAGRRNILDSIATE
jgi:putative ABC transport system permease protein